MPSLLDLVDQFVDCYLNGYEVSKPSRKHIHDPLWGGIELSPLEQALVDTPLIQRLRQIHQTGCVFETYPTAQHSRFEHTLGVVHLAGRIAENLVRKYPESVTEDSVNKVRLAALFHDVGHSAFSHTTEEIYSSCPDIAELIGDTGEFAGKGAGELLSYLVVTSQAFREHFGRLTEALGFTGVEVDDFAPLILGRAKSPELQFEADIISGPFDADKLDYFPRDGRSAGLSLTLDTDRLLGCMELADVSPQIYVPEASDSRARKTLVVNRGGFNPLQQLLFARATLFSTVYHHHKVRACDCLIKAAFESFKRDEKPFKATKSKPAGLKLESAADFLYLTDLDFFAEAHSHEEDTDQHKFIHDLLYRRLPKRVVVISAHTIKGMREVVAAESALFANYADFLALQSDPEQLREFAQDIALKAGADINPLSVWCDIPKRPNFNKAGDALINLSSQPGKPRIERLAKFIPTESWVETYQQYYAQSFIFGPSNVDQRKRVAQAAITILKDRFNLELNEYALPADIRPESEG